MSDIHTIFNEEGAIEDKKGPKDWNWSSEHQAGFIKITKGKTIENVESEDIYRLSFGDTIFDQGTYKWDIKYDHTGSEHCAVGVCTPETQ